MVCKNCSHEFESGNFCPNCGTPAPKDENITCSACGTKFVGKFCPNCGTAANAQKEPEVIEEIPAAEPVPEEIPAEAAPVSETEPAAEPALDEPAAYEAEQAEEPAEEIPAADEAPVQPAESQPVYEQPAYTAQQPIYTQPSQPIYTPQPQQTYQNSYQRPAYQPPVKPGSIAAPALTPKLKEIFSDTLFFICAILLSAGTCIGFFTTTASSGFFSAVLSYTIPVLLTIAIWLIFASAKSQANVFKVTGLKIASGTIKALFIVYWVLVGLLGIVLILVGAGASFLGNLLYDMDLGGLYYGVGYLGIGIIVVMLLVLIAVLIVVNLLFVTKLRKFVKSLQNSALSGNAAFVKVKATRQWLFVLGIILGVVVLMSFISTVSSYYVYSYTIVTSLFSLLASCSTAASFIVLSLWIKKYFTDC